MSSGKQKIQKPHQNKNLKTKIVLIGQDRLQEAAHIFTSNLISSNPLCKKMDVTYDQFKQFTKEKMMLSSQSYKLVSLLNQQNNQIVATSYSYDLIDNIDSKVKPPRDSAFFTRLEADNTLLTKKYFQELRPKLKRGQYAYGGGATNFKYDNSGFIKKLLNYALVYLRILGYKYLVTLATNIIAKNIFIELGSEIINQVSIKDQFVKDEKLWLLRLQLQKLNVKQLNVCLGECVADEEL